MPLLAAWTPDHWEVSHTDEIVQPVDFNKPVDVVGITANTPAAPHAYALAQEFRRRVWPWASAGPLPHFFLRKGLNTRAPWVSARGGWVCPNCWQTSSAVNSRVFTDPRCCRTSAK